MLSVGALKLFKMVEAILRQSEEPRIIGEVFGLYLPELEKDADLIDSPEFTDDDDSFSF